MTARAVTLLFEYGLAVHGIAPSRRDGVEVAHRSDVCNEPREVGCCVSARRHGRAWNAGLDQAVQVGIRGDLPELVRSQIDARNRITIRAVTGNAVRVVKIEPGLHIGLRVLCKRASGPASCTRQNQTTFSKHVPLLLDSRSIDHRTQTPRTNDMGSHRILGAHPSILRSER